MVLEKHQQKINFVAIGTGVLTIITIVTFFFTTSGSFVLARKDIDDAKEFIEIQKLINTSQVETNTKTNVLLESMNKNIELILNKVIYK